MSIPRPTGWESCDLCPVQPEYGTRMPSTTDDLTESYEPDPIVVPVRDILDGVVGSMTGVEIGRVDSETLAWAGVGATGSVRSGMRRLSVEDDARSIMLAWDVDVDEPACREDAHDCGR